MAPLQDHRFIPKPHLPLLQFRASHLRNPVPIFVSSQKTKIFNQIPPPHAPNSLQKQFSSQKIRTSSGNPIVRISEALRIHVAARKTSPLLRIPASILRSDKNIKSCAKTPSARRPDSLFDLLSSIDLQASPQKVSSFSKIPAVCHNFALLAAISFPFPTHAAEAEQVSSKINMEQIIVSIDDFFNRNPFVVAGVSFIWLVVVPLTQGYLRKYKFISAIDAFRKLRDMPNAQLLDVRNRKSVKYMASANLKILNKNVVHVEYSEGNEEGFVKQVLQNFGDPENTVICVLDNFDGESLKLAELLHNNGFKEAYAIKGGLRGKNGWEEIQETYLPPSVHVYPRKKSRVSAQTEVNNQIINEKGKENGNILASPSNHQDKNLNTDNGSVKPAETISAAKLYPERPLSPYPNYPELKPPSSSSPSPSKPRR